MQPILVLGMSGRSEYSVRFEALQSTLKSLEALESASFLSASKYFEAILGAFGRFRAFWGAFKRIKALHFRAL